MALPVNAFSPLLHMTLNQYHATSRNKDATIVLQKSFLRAYTGSSNALYNKQHLVDCNSRFKSVSPTVDTLSTTKITTGKLVIEDLIIPASSCSTPRHYHLDLTGVVDYMHTKIMDTKTPIPIVSVQPDGSVRGSNIDVTNDRLGMKTPYFNTKCELIFSDLLSDHVRSFVQFSGYEYNSTNVLVYYEATNMWELQSLDKNIFDRFNVILSPNNDDLLWQRWFRVTARSLLENRIDDDSIDKFIDLSLLDPSGLLNICDE
jgi:hypothetical protein